jgi:glyoxylase-like metal-dependent hydrolase (beta-lactamase superfamily II)/rhodanese-related sulfurtransferase
MYFQQFYLSCLAHASYLIGSGDIAAVVDPQRDVDIYLEDAEKQGLKIAYIIETHLHADFVSGHQELAARTGAEIHVSVRAGAYFPHHDMREGDEICFGSAALRFLETPGHSADSICILVTDRDRSPEPWAVLTGDTLFIGEVGRPDLSPDYTPKELASMLYDSLRGKLLTLPDNVEIYPAHGAGSLCGRNISPERHSTIGKERALNYALRPMSREEFVRLMVTDLPERPEYFFRDKEINRAGAPSVANFERLRPLSAKEVASRQAHAVVIDTRPAAQFGAGHLPGSIHIALCGQYASWAGTLLGLDTRVIVVAENAERAEEARVRLARVGLDKTEGYLQDGVQAWQEAGLPLEDVPQISVLQLYGQLSSHPEAVQVIDVRRPGEWAAGHIDQARLKPLHKLGASLDDLNPQRPIAAYCKSGYRSSIGTSLLQRAGFKQVMNVVGGFDAWELHKLRTAVDTPQSN